MKISARAHHLAVIGVVVTGAVASIATTRVFADLEASLDLPTVQLSEAHPVAIYRLHAAGTGSAVPSYNSLYISASTTQTATVPLLFTASTSVEPPENLEPFETTSTGTSVTINCKSLPCEDDVAIRIELRPRPDGTWPAPSEWMISADLRIEFDDRRDVPPGTSATLELVP